MPEPIILLKFHGVMSMDHRMKIQQDVTAVINNGGSLVLQAGMDILAIINGDQVFVNPTVAVEVNTTNKCIIIGNLTKDPELRTTSAGIIVCTFKVAVNKRVKSGEHPEADFFKVTAWRELGERCQKYLTKGKKVCVTGPVSINTYEGRDGNSYTDLEITADDVEFLSPKDAEGVAGDGQAN